MLTAVGLKTTEVENARTNKDLSIEQFSKRKLSNNLTDYLKLYKNRIPYLI